MRLGVAQIQGIDHHADVGGVLAGLPHMRYLDQFECGLVHAALELLITIPIAIGLLHHDIALEQQTLQDLFDIERRILGVTHAQRHVLEIAVQGHVLGCWFSAHFSSGLLQRNVVRTTTGG